ncbi:MAG: Gmad2 immunoglobulin-like domain-containing protein [Patescibacteria group bacterium]
MKIQHIGFIILVFGLFSLVAWNGFIKNPELSNTELPDTPPALEVAYSNASADLIVVDELVPGQYISSPLTVHGMARGFWFFEASFPVIVVDWDGLIIAEGIAQAQDEWMTEEFVPFSVTLTFTKPIYNERGALIFKRDNPSGLPENDAALEIPIRFE